MGRVSGRACLVTGAAQGIGRAIGEALAEFRRSGDIAPVQDAMRTAYGDAVYDAAFKGMDRDAFLEAAANVTDGVPIATPVFDGAKEGDVNDALVRAGFDTSLSAISISSGSCGAALGGGLRHLYQGKP